MRTYFEAKHVVIFRVAKFCYTALALFLSLSKQAIADRVFCRAHETITTCVVFRQFQVPSLHARHPPSSRLHVAVWLPCQSSASVCLIHRILRQYSSFHIALRNHGTKSINNDIVYVTATAVDCPKSRVVRQSRMQLSHFTQATHSRI